MNVKIKRRWDAESNEWSYRATCYGPGNESYYCDGYTPGKVLQALSSGDMIAGLIYASTLLDYKEQQHKNARQFQNERMDDLRKKNAKLRKELKELKK